MYMRVLVMDVSSHIYMYNHTCYMRRILVFEAQKGKCVMMMMTSLLLIDSKHRIESVT